MTVEIWLLISLVVSLGLNILLFLFSRDISKRYYVVLENLDDLVLIISDYRTHLRDIYAMEMFYGDETLELLMAHTRDLLDILENDYGDISLIENIIEHEEEYEEEYEKSEEESIPQVEKDVFYGGTRKRNS